MRAIAFELGADKLLHIRYGESEFKTIDEFWTDFTPDNEKKSQTLMKGSIIKDTELNRAVVTELHNHYAIVKQYNDEADCKMYQIRNKLDRSK